jgi:hypothetical protein
VHKGVSFRRPSFRRSDLEMFEILHWLIHLKCCATELRYRIEHTMTFFTACATEKKKSAMLCLTRKLRPCFVTPGVENLTCNNCWRRICTSSLANKDAACICCSCWCSRCRATICCCQSIQVSEEQNVLVCSNCCCEDMRLRGVLDCVNC